MPPSETPPSQQSPSPFGIFRRDFRVVKHKLKRDFRIGFGLLFVILALIAIVAGLYTSWNAVRLHGRAALLQTIPLPLLIFLLGLLLGILLLSYSRRHWHDRVSIYENGLVLQKGKESTPWLWDDTACFKAEITAIKFGTGMIGEKVRLVFENAQGQKLLLPGRYEEMNSLVELVRQSLLPRMYKNTVDRMLKGESIPFTPELNAVLKGLVIREDLCRWAALNPPQLTKGALILSRIGDNKVIYKTPIKKVGNLDLLLTFLENPPTG